MNTRLGTWVPKSIYPSKQTIQFIFRKVHGELSRKYRAVSAVAKNEKHPLEEQGRTGVQQAQNISLGLG